MDFTLSVVQCRLVERNRQKIQELFRVAVQLPDRDLLANTGGSNSAAVWVEISGERERAVKAKAYMLSLCNGNEVTERLPADVLDHIDLSDIELSTQAFLTRLAPQELRIQGDQMTIAKAKSLLDQKHQLYERRRLSGFHGNDVNAISSSMQQDVQNEYNVQDIVGDPLRVQRPSKEMNGRYMQCYPVGQIDVVAPTRTSLTDSKSCNIPSSKEQIVVLPPKSQPTLSKTHGVMTQQNPAIIKDSNSKVLRTLSNNQDFGGLQESLIARGGSCYSSTKNTIGNIAPDIDPEPPVINVSSSSRTVDSFNVPTSSPRSEDNTCSIIPSALISESEDPIVIPSNSRTEDTIGMLSNPRTENATINPNDLRSEDIISDLRSEDITISPSTPRTEDGATDAIKRQKSVDRTRTVEIELVGKTLNDQYEQMQKLGFSRNQVDDAIQQLGPDTSADELLGVLVKRSQNKIPNATESPPAMPEERIRDVSDSTSTEDDADNLRTIIIDGSNVAMSFGNKDVFACKGIEIVVNWFLERGHRAIYVFVPSWRKEAPKPDSPITDQQILHKLEKLRILVFTPSRRINGRRIVCYDDRYIIKTAVEVDGIVVSNDNFRDLQNEKREFKKIIEERLLMYSFVGKQFMPPDDPLGKHGPSLDNYLRIRPTAPDRPLQPCPYDKKCTYGNKCKFYHPERQGQTQKSISQTLKEKDDARKREQLNAILEGYRSDDYKGYHDYSMHEGIHTEPIPRPPMLDHDPKLKTGPLPGYRPGLAVNDSSRSASGSESGSNPNIEATGASARQFVPYTVSGYNQYHPLPPPNVHGAEQGRYFTEPLPRPTDPRVDVHGSGTVPLANVDRRSSTTHGDRHSSLPPGSGPYRDLQEQMERLRIEGANQGRHPDMGYPRYTGYPDHSRPVSYDGRGYHHDSNSAPLPHPEQRRHVQNAAGYHRQPPYAGNYGNYANSQPSNHAGHHHGSNYPSNPTSNQWQHGLTSLPTRMPPHQTQTGQQSLYPNLQSVVHDQERFHTYPNEQSVVTDQERFHSYPNEQPRRPLERTSYAASPVANPTGPSLDQRRKNFLRAYTHVYTEDAILAIFAKYPNEANEQRLHQRINHFLKY